MPTVQPRESLNLSNPKTADIIKVESDIYTNCNCLSFSAVTLLKRWFVLYIVSEK